MAAPKSRIPLVLGLTVAGAGGYYLYSAGGSPKVAQKEIEHDAARVSAKVKSELPGREKEAKKQGEEWGEKAGAKFDSALGTAKGKLNDADASLEASRKNAADKLEAYRKETGKDLQQGIDTFDKKVEDGASKAKSGVSSWFGGK
ncbi:MAG: hypothetical protein M1819_003538 [Sarea resinae]|nr:MAG: hypothetical protein M1819_003538 [Sarea resinae]